MIGSLPRMRGFGEAAEGPPSSFTPSGQTESGGAATSVPGFDWNMLASTAGAALVAKFGADAAKAQSKANADAIRAATLQAIRQGRAAPAATMSPGVVALIALGGLGIVTAIVLAARRR